MGQALRKSFCYALISLNDCLSQQKQLRFNYGAGEFFMLYLDEMAFTMHGLYIASVAKLKNNYLLK